MNALQKIMLQKFVHQATIRPQEVRLHAISVLLENTALVQLIVVLLVVQVLTQLQAQRLVNHVLLDTHVVLEFLAVHVVLELTLMKVIMVAPAVPLSITVLMEMLLSNVWKDTILLEVLQLVLPVK